MPNALNGRHHAAIQGLPEAPIYCWVQGKAPKYEAWNNPRNLLTPERLFEETPPKGFQPDGFGMVSGRWSGTMAVDFDAKPERPEQAEATFRNITGYSSDALPPSATVISGRPGRRRVILLVPAAWNVPLAGYSADLQDLELRWEAESESGGPAPIQSVICGNHPDCSDWHFRWQDGLSPAEVGIAEAPVWLLAAMVRHKGLLAGLDAAAEEGAGAGGRGAGEPGPCDLLEPRLQRKLIRDVLAPAWPYRGGATGSRFAASWKSDGYRSLLAALNNVLGPAMAADWLKGTPWLNSHEDFGPYDTLQEAMVSIGKSHTQRKAGWGTLVGMATRTCAKNSDGSILESFEEPPAKLPPWALPPRTIDFDDFGIRVEQNMKQLRTFMENVEQLDTPAQREMAMVQIKQNTGYKDNELKVMLRHLQDEKNGVSEKGGFWDDVVANAKEISVAVERFLPFSAITMIGADPGVGKSTFLYRLARAVAYGEDFAGGLQTVQGNVLIVQKDESDSNMRQKQMLSGITDPEKRIRVEFNFSKGHFKELRNWIEEHEAKYVFMDSFGSIFGADGDLSDVDAGIVLYGLNEIAARYGCAVVLTHHFRKADKSKGDKRQSVTLGDFFGSTYIAAGTSDAWGLYRDPEAGDEELAYLLKNVKPRSGVAQMGDCFRLLGSVEDLSIQVDRLNAVEDGVSKLREGERLLLAALRRGSSDKPCLVTAVDPDVHNDLQRDTGLSRPTVQRLLNGMYSSGRWGIERRVVPVVGKGKAPMGYWVRGVRGK